MSDFEIVRRPRLEPHSGSGADPGKDWRRFVLDQVGYDEVARARAERHRMRVQAVRRFLTGLLGGLSLCALAFGALQGVRSWRAGRLDHYMPHVSEPVATPPSSRWMRTNAPPEATEDRDTHVILKNPLAPPPHAVAAESEDSGSGSTETAAGDDDN